MTLDLMFRPSGSGSSSGTAWTVTSQTTNYNAAVSDYVLSNSSGGTFTVTLPASPGAAGSQIAIQKTDSSFTAVTIAGNGNNINGSSSTTVDTQYELIILTWSGTAWFLERYIDENATSYTPTTGGLGTTTNNNFYWSRNGRYLFIQATCTTGTVAASTASVSIPSGLTIDSIISSSFNSVVGQCSGAGAGGPFWTLATGGGTTINFSFGANAITAQNGNAIFSNTQNITFYAKVPISGWKG